MPEPPAQNYANHIRHDKMAYFYLALLLVTFIVAVVALFVEGDRILVAAVLMNTVATLLLATNARGYGIKVQDRVVRLEMRLRLKEVLGGDAHGRINDFTLSQLVGLRFASDAELPELSRKVLDENITSARQIKQMVTDWQPDHLRV
ncbi:MAG: hypothetical protein IIB38_02335 [Candidatus Hydrogenedentes bacterium]|nr:hypothetical protein [Candidatus Hydrogenedentota bacterium]